MTFFYRVTYWSVYAVRRRRRRRHRRSLARHRSRTCETRSQHHDGFRPVPRSTTTIIRSLIIIFFICPTASCTDGVSRAHGSRLLRDAGVDFGEIPRSRARYILLYTLAYGRAPDGGSACCVFRHRDFFRAVNVKS